MSMLRISRPGLPPAHIDLGPDTGRITHARAAIRGGAIVETMTVRPKKDRNHQAEWARRQVKR